MDYDQDVLSRYYSQDALPAATGLPEAIRACAPLVEKKGDWAALYMLLQERGKTLGYTEFCKAIAAHAPDSPQPLKQHVQAAEWDTHRRRFPDWQPEGISYDKFRRHYLIAQKAADNL